MSRIAYFLNRAREAGLCGVAQKIGQKVVPYLYWPRYALFRSVPRGDIQSLTAFGSMVSSGFRSALSGDESYLGRVEGRVRAALSGERIVIGYGETKAPAGLGWYMDSFHRYSWKPRYFPLCDYLAAEEWCDVKVPWELSRLQWLAWLAEGSVLLDEDESNRCRNAALDCLRDWDRFNPAGYGVNWACGMEVAIRGINLAFGLTPMLPRVQEGDRKLVLRCLSEHLEYLCRFPERSDVPGNHYLADLLGVLTLSVALHGAHSIDASRELDRFAKEAGRQFDLDGCHIERSTIYHRLCLEMVSIARALMHGFGMEPHQSLEDTFQRASGFAASIASCGGNLPIIGDQDSGFVLWFGERAQQLDGRIFGKPGENRTDLYTFLSAVSGLNCGFFPRPAKFVGASVQSEFGVLKGAEFETVMKAGPQGLCGRAPHDHDDALHVSVFVGGQPLLVDAGSHSYTLDPKIRLESILSSAHNTPRIADRENFAAVEGSIMPSVRGAHTADARIVDKDSIEGDLDVVGSLYVRRRVSLIRTFDSESLSIVDYWKCAELQRIASTWVLAEGWVAKIDGMSVGETPATECIVATSFPIALRHINYPHADVALFVESDVPINVSFDTRRISPDYGAWVDVVSMSITTAACVKGYWTFRVKNRVGHRGV